MIAELLASITAKIEKLAQRLVDAANVESIKSERDEALAALQSIDAKLNSL